MTTCARSSSSSRHAAWLVMCIPVVVMESQRQTWCLQVRLLLPRMVLYLLRVNASASMHSSSAQRLTSTSYAWSVVVTRPLLPHRLTSTRRLLTYIRHLSLNARVCLHATLPSCPSYRRVRNLIATATRCSIYSR